MFNDQLLSDLQKQLDLLKEPGAFPVNPVIEQALHLIHQLMEEADGGTSNGSLEGRVTALEQEVALIGGIQGKLVELEGKVNDCTTSQEVQILIDTSLNPIQSDISALQNSYASLNQRVTVLENDPPNGVPASRVREIVKEETKDIRDYIKELKDSKLPGIDGAIEDLDRRVAALEEQPPGEGVSESRVKELIEAEAQLIRGRINDLKQEVQTDLRNKADKSALSNKADKTALNAKADKSELAKKASKAELETSKQELEGKLEKKADRSALANKADKAALKQKADKTALDGKADKSALADKADKADLDKKADKTALADKVDKADLDAKADKSALAGKADKTDLDEKADKTALADKADKADLEQKADKTALADKADKADLDEKADKTALGDKADKADLEQKADKSALADKADKADLEQKADKTALGDKADKADLEQKADKTALGDKADKTALDAKADKTELDEKADKTVLENVEQQLGDKADKTALDAKADKTELDEKADKTVLENVEQQLGDKADKTALDAKADKTELDEKADKSVLENVEQQLGDKADKTALDTKADKTELDEKADKSVLENVEQQLVDKADKTALDAKADKTELDEKADKSVLENVEQQLVDKADKTALDTKADKTELDEKADKSVLENVEQQLVDKADKTALDAKADKTALEGVEEQLADKADKTGLQELEEEVETLKEDWLKDSINNPGVRLARLSLQGWGVAGGFEMFSDDKDYIHLTPGMGITPAGELITEPGIMPNGTSAGEQSSMTMDDDTDSKDEAEGESEPYDPCHKEQPQNLVFSHCKPYRGAEHYHFFKKPGTEEGYQVWELLQPTEHLPADSRPLTPQNDAEWEYPFITNKVVAVLLVDNAPVYVLMEREDVLEQLCCLPHQCDPNPQFDPDYIFEEDYSEEDDYISDEEVWACLYPATRLPEIPLFRFGFFTDEDCAPDELDQTDFPTIETIDSLFDTWCPIIDDAISRLEKTVQMLMRRYHHSLFPLLEQRQFEEKLGMLSNKWTRFKVSNQVPQTDKDDLGTKYYTQYFYDWLRDLIGGYHELRWALIALMDDLRPYTAEMLSKQHRHLLLGMAHQVDSNGVSEPLRDTFHQPPIHNGNAARLETCRLYYRRLFQMIEGFYLPDFAPESLMPGWCYNENENGETEEQEPNFDAVKITPSKQYIYPLSRQSIPYYYPLLDHPQSLHHYWNYERSKSRSADRILSYHATDIPPEFPSYSTRKEVIRPLFYTLDDHDFYRIEGIVGKSQVHLYPKTEENDHEYDVFDALQYLVKKHNLDFQVIKLEVSKLQRIKDDRAPMLHSIQDAQGKGEESSYSYSSRLMGAEHLGGVPKGGAFIVVYDNDGRTVIADLSLPDKLPRELAKDLT